MRTPRTLCAAATAVVLVALTFARPMAAQRVTFSVSGRSDPWLAGMPPGSTASSTDVAPTHSPTQLLGLGLAAGGSLTFSATGAVGHPTDVAGPDGFSFSPHHDAGAQNGIADVTAPFNALVGVFLGGDQPNLSPAPSALDFSSAVARDYLVLFPALKQVFFIGDGLTSASAVQRTHIPAGATRLFLGTMDSFEWRNNTGAFSVTVTAVAPTSVPEPNTLTLAGVGMAVIGAVGVARHGRPRRDGGQ